MISLRSFESYQTCFEVYGLQLSPLCQKAVLTHKTSFLLYLIKYGHHLDVSLWPVSIYELPKTVALLQWILLLSIPLFSFEDVLRAAKIW